MAEYPQLLHTVLDTTRPREPAEFYRQLLGLRNRTGDDVEGHLTRRIGSCSWTPTRSAKLAFQQVDRLPRWLFRVLLPEPAGRLLREAPS
jgi:hypothetical protein